MSSNQQEIRKVNDVIYGFTHLERKYWHFIDTEQFQRLRRIKKLGCLEYVFPCATHSVFEHSLGAAYLGKLFIQNLIKNNPNAYKFEKQKIAEIKDSFVLACLLKNLGAAPFGRIFHQFANETLIYDHEKVQDAESKETLPSFSEKNVWNQQSVSIIIFQKMFENQKYPHLNALFGAIKQRIKILIVGEKQQRRQASKTIYHQRPWQIQLVNNTQGGISIDNLQSYRRDSKYLGATQVFIDNQLLMTEARIVFSKQTQDWHHTICYPTKYIETIYNFFNSRYALSRQFYFNKISCGIELVILDIFNEISKRSQIRPAYQQLMRQLGRYNSIKRFSFDLSKILNIQESFNQYLKLTDSILNRIEYIHMKNQQKHKKDSSYLNNAKQLVQDYMNPFQKRNNNLSLLKKQSTLSVQQQNELTKAMQAILQEQQAKKIQNAVNLIQNIKYRKVYKFFTEFAYYISAKPDEEKQRQNNLYLNQNNINKKELSKEQKQANIQKFIVKKIHQLFSGRNIQKQIYQYFKQEKSIDKNNKKKKILQKICVDVQDGTFGTSYLNPIQKVGLIKKDINQWKIIKKQQLKQLGKRYLGVSVENSVKIYFKNQDSDQYEDGRRIIKAIKSFINKVKSESKDWPVQIEFSEGKAGSEHTSNSTIQQSNQEKKGDNISELTQSSQKSQQQNLSHQTTKKNIEASQLAIPIKNDQ